jgi:hypothetical protein
LSKKDERYVYGACCTWHGPIQEVKSVGGPVTVNGRRVDVDLPGCPHCLGPLMEYDNRAEWDEAAARFQSTHPECPLYIEWLESMRAGHCTLLKGWDWRKAYQEFAAARTIN